MSAVTEAEAIIAALERDQDAALGLALFGWALLPWAVLAWLFVEGVRRWTR